MSLLTLIKAQFGKSNTPANNFVLDASADNGTMKLARGNAGATTQDILTVDANGRVRMPQNLVAFRVYSGDTVSVPSGTSTRLTFPVGSIRFDTSSSLGSSRFTPQAAGYYQINFSAGFTGAGGAVAFAQTALHKNGTLYSATMYSPVYNFINGAASAVVYMNGTTDYLEIFATQNSGGALNMSVIEFSGFLVAAA